MKISNINWGDDSAEKDPNLLHYFISQDAVDRLARKQKSLVVGRKGSGKSAVRKKLSDTFTTAKQSHVLNLSPKFQSIKTILNDKDLTSGMGEEILFTHTWLRQIYLDCICAVGHGERNKFSVESFEFARNIANQQNRTSKDIVENIADVLSRIKGKVTNLGEFGINIERELRDVADVDALEHHFLEIAKVASFVVLVDDLDLGWNNSETANNLILGLLTAANYISSKTNNAFVCIFLREDVYSILITKTQHSDKYRNIERLRWEKDSLIQLLGERINFNRKEAGEPEFPNPFSTVFPTTIGTSNTDNWLVERTLSRPRELIQLARYYSEKCESDTPDVEALKAAELGYSEWKLDDLCTEYSNQFPGLVDIFSYWKTKFYRYKYHLKADELETMVLDMLVETELNQPWFNAISDNVDVQGLLKILYEIGFIGDFVLGGDGGSKTVYSYQGNHQPRFEEVDIHPCFRKAVGTVDRIRSRPQEAGG
ncbi:P-loop ATPase, Sll1717 family [Xanthomonas campestris]|uniref:P-loop ATPase, Sll1717 family n=1 Tax=Xanthomonas campestris TaxID=339 RepID=UPI000AEB8AF1|nr:hypothetical protein [Xanthomonas campestris]MEB1152909.1 hypothetical protein [Xanthomonas campestris pv. campestris]MCC5098864.1 hypothetical protein [Xanthomonas campestris]MEA9585555.1 hypothetical protein [Xanthomonas campestris]MEA9593493.1 hypothetical protein [Xanthomonas campestris]MEA9625425.1 hypothetical protein [Xanthomonas campestris]